MAVWEAGWLDLVIGLVALPIVATLLMSLRRRSAAPLRLGGAGHLVTLAHVAVTVTIVPAAAAVFYGSMALVAGLQGNGGCEITALANWLRGRDDQIGCPLFAPFLLHGSLTLDDFTPGRSDIDLLAIVETPLSDDQLSALGDAVDRVRKDAPSRIDLRVVTRTTAGSPTRLPAMEAAFVLRPGQDREIETRVAHEPDLIVEFSMARAHGRSIVGGAPEAVIGTVPKQWALEIGDRQLATWERLTDDADHAELMVLTACRIWRLSIEGVHRSKTAAGRWALERDPSLRAVEQALRQRTVDPAAPIGEEGIRRVLALVRQELL
ncbi:MAG: aminoglycoside adenylyltransferase domain-containing protein [Thermoleophilaceae bacterium]